MKGTLLFILTDLAVHVAILGGRSSLIFKQHGSFFQYHDGSWSVISPNTQSTDIDQFDGACFNLG